MLVPTVLAPRTAASTLSTKRPHRWAGLALRLHIKEILLLNLLVVMQMPVPAALVDPLVMLRRLDSVLRSAAS